MRSRGIGLFCVDLDLIEGGGIDGTVRSRRRMEANQQVRVYGELSCCVLC